MTQQSIQHANQRTTEHREKEKRRRTNARAWIIIFDFWGGLGCTRHPGGCSRGSRGVLEDRRMDMITGSSETWISNSLFGGPGGNASLASAQSAPCSAHHGTTAAAAPSTPHPPFEVLFAHRLSWLVGFIRLDPGHGISAFLPRAAAVHGRIALAPSLPRRPDGGSSPGQSRLRQPRRVNHTPQLEYIDDHL